MRVDSHHRTVGSADGGLGEIDVVDSPAGRQHAGLQRQRREGHAAGCRQVEHRIGLHREIRRRHIGCSRSVHRHDVCGRNDAVVDEHVVEQTQVRVKIGLQLSDRQPRRRVQCVRRAGPRLREQAVNVQTRLSTGLIACGEHVVPLAVVYPLCGVDRHVRVPHTEGRVSSRQARPEVVDHIGDFCVDQAVPRVPVIDGTAARGLVRVEPEGDREIVLHRTGDRDEISVAVEFQDVAAGRIGDDLRIAVGGTRVPAARVVRDRVHVKRVMCHRVVRGRTAGTANGGDVQSAACQGHLGGPPQDISA